ncbi:MAG: Asp23/Gls24 family envelope stress response protein [Bacillota bacterium]
MSETTMAQGKIEIAEEVLSIIAVTAAMEVEGVATMSSKTFTEFFGKKGNTKCIRVWREDNVAVVDIEIVLNFGEKVPKVAKEVQEKVKSALETMAGVEVQAVNVTVSAITKEKASSPLTKEEV